tara:strand:+ start:95 stop:379 length:285 start_codon:yes stop_codon:yes gene_type:complete
MAETNIGNLMEKFGKGIFGKGFNLKAEVTKGQCPLCETKTVFVSIYQNFYRCMNCGADTEQKVNGVISYMPVSLTGCGTVPEIKVMDFDGPQEA